jgi:hypothetical protein
VSVQCLYIHTDTYNVLELESRDRDCTHMNETCEFSPSTHSYLYPQVKFTIIFLSAPTSSPAFNQNVTLFFSNHSNPITLISLIVGADRGGTKFT